MNSKIDDEELIKISNYLRERGYCIIDTIPENCKCTVAEIGIVGAVESGEVGCIKCAEKHICSYCRVETTTLYKEYYCHRCSWRNINDDGKPYHSNSWW